MRWVSSYLAFPPLRRRKLSIAGLRAGTEARSLCCSSFQIKAGFDLIGERDDSRYISVALVRGSPLADVIRYPRPLEPGLSSRTRFRCVPAAVRPAHDGYFITGSGEVNIFLEFAPLRTYNISDCEANCIDLR